MKRCLSDRQVIEISLERLVGKTSDLFKIDGECVRVDRRLRSWSGIDLGVTTWVVTTSSHAFVKAQFFYTTQPSKKLVEKYLGPFKVITQVGTHSFML